jgi:hypothetical protein
MSLKHKADKLQAFMCMSTVIELAHLDYKGYYTLFMSMYIFNACGYIQGCQTREST